MNYFLNLKLVDQLIDNQLCHEKNTFVSNYLIGSVLDYKGNVLKKYCHAKAHFPSGNLPNVLEVPNALTRKPITEIFETGIKAIDGLLTVGIGQRVLIVAEPGVGKSTFLAMLANNSSVEIVIVALIGERGREIREFVENSLGSVIDKCILVISTSSQSSNDKITAAETAKKLADFYRRDGFSVLLLFDSLTRYARALREPAVCNGERLVQGGYPLSVFDDLSYYVECAGNDEVGSVTAFYTVLSSTEIVDSVLVEHLESVCDGHFYLDKALAEKAHYPAVNCLKSLSRLSTSLQSEEHKLLSKGIVAQIAKLKTEKDYLIFADKLDTELSKLLASEEFINQFLVQEKSRKFKLEKTYQLLRELNEVISS